jgi:hypothetical protein
MNLKRGRNTFGTVVRTAAEKTRKTKPGEKLRYRFNNKTNNITQKR